MHALLDCFRNAADVSIDPERAPKVSIIGAGGKVAREAIRTIYERNTGPLQLTLISRTPARAQGAALDVRSAMSLPREPQGRPLVKPLADCTDDIKKVEGSRMVIVVAGTYLNAAEAELFRQKDASGRLSQAYANYHLMSEIAQQVSTYARGALMVVVTNQSDMMADVARENHDYPWRVLGFGGMIDSARFRDYAAEALKTKAPFAPEPQIEAHMIGYHNKDMILLDSSFSHKLALTSTETNQLVEDTRVAGAYVSKLQRRADFISNDTGAKLDTGASVLPGTALGLCALAVVGQGRLLTASFNTFLKTEALAKHYGVSLGTSLSVPIDLGPDGYSVSSAYPVAEQEKTALREAVRNMKADCAALRDVVNKPALV